MRYWWYTFQASSILWDIQQPLGWSISSIILKLLILRTKETKTNKKLLKKKT